MVMYKVSGLSFKETPFAFERDVLFGHVTKIAISHSQFLMQSAAND